MPTHLDCEKEQDNVRDVFGRTRHASYKTDMTGLGSFNNECKTLFFSGFPVTREGDEDPIKTATKQIYKLFSPWGEIDDIHINQRSSSGGNQVYVSFTHRYYAEFAREAMANQMDVYEG